MARTGGRLEDLPGPGAVVAMTLNHIPVRPGHPEDVSQAVAVLAGYERRRFAASCPNASPEACAVCGQWCPFTGQSKQQERED